MVIVKKLVREVKLKSRPVHSTPTQTLISFSKSSVLEAKCGQLDTKGGSHYMVCGPPSLLTCREERVKEEFPFVIILRFPVRGQNYRNRI